jgi:hypothetical protein
MEANVLIMRSHSSVHDGFFSLLMTVISNDALSKQSGVQVTGMDENLRTPAERCRRDKGCGRYNVGPTHAGGGASPAAEPWTSGHETKK